MGEGLLLLLLFLFVVLGLFLLVGLRDLDLVLLVFLWVWVVLWLSSREGGMLVLVGAGDVLPASWVCPLGRVWGGGGVEGVAECV